MLISVSQVACDTVAEITFRQESLDRVTVLGFRAEHCQEPEDPLAECRPPGCGHLEFVMETNQSRFLTPGLKLEGLEERVRPGTTTFDVANITFDRSFIFELDTTPGPTAGLDKTCTSDADCSTGFTCRSFSVEELPANDFLAQRSAQFCARPATIQVSPASLEFVGLRDDPQPDNPRTGTLDKSGVSLIVAMDNSASVGGVAGDKTTASDPLADRIAAMLTFFSVLTDENRSSLTGNSLDLAIFELKGTGAGGVIDVLGETFGSQTGGRTFTSDVDVAGDAMQSLTNTTANATPIWEGLVEAARVFREEASADQVRQVLLFTDSDSDGSSGSGSAENAINALALNEVTARASVLHLDSLAPTDTDTLAQRTGPLSEYQRLACEREGYYVYEQYPTALDPQLRERLGLAYESTWRLQVELFAGTDALSELEPGWYRVGGSMSVSLANNTEVFNMALQTVSQFSDETFDTRLLIEVSAP